MGKIVERKELNFLEKSYIPEIIRGLVVTSKHFFRNLFNWKKIPTIQYPEVKHELSDRLRGKHRLMLYEDGRLRCTACFLCATACPAKCITITAAEHEDPKVEKYPIEYTIDLSKCVFCGFCFEACPCDAIRMDAGLTKTTSYKREELKLTIDILSKKVDKK
ncbi:NADH-quinone oxidoreductase subunit I [bacterium]|nr:NADH-quinone oxidoreductase subunit I [bacterium]